VLELALDVEVEREPHRHRGELREVGDLHSQCSRWRPFFLLRLLFFLLGPLICRPFILLPYYSPSAGAT
jgi:hypothetical protein